MIGTKPHLPTEIKIYKRQEEVLGGISNMREQRRQAGVGSAI